MMRVINSKDSNSEAGVYIENGVMTPYKNIDLTQFLKDLREYKEQYDPSKAKNMHHIARLEGDIVENIRIINKYPQSEEGWNLAVKKAVEMVKNGDLKIFAVHDA